MIFKEGNKLVAKSVCKMRDGSGNALVIGHSYFISKIEEYSIYLDTEIFIGHEFSLDDRDNYYWGNFFYTPIESRENNFKELNNDK